MRTLQELKEKLEGYGSAEFIYYQDTGYLAWHFSTGANIETLFIEAKPGCGSWLYRKMVEKILETGKIPYHSVFCFTLESNERAIGFYRKMGWTQVFLGQSIYRDDTTVLCWTTWQDLLTYMSKGANDESD